MPKVLLVSPHFPPVNTADLHRVRLILPHLKDMGWEAEVLAVEPAQVDSPPDPWLAEGLPPEVPVHRVRALGLGWRRLPGLGTLGWRACRALGREGDRLLSTGSFDLVYFSTTVFETHILGPRWKALFGVPFGMDYQDPWVDDYHRGRPDLVPPGGRLKHGVAQALHRWMEPRVLRACAGITAVSADYVAQLARRYPHLRLPPATVLPFPGARQDLARAGSEPFGDGLRHWVYVGRGGPDMAPALRGLFAALRDHASEHLRKGLRLHFVGTSYAAAGSGAPSIVPVAREYGLEGLVEERTERIPYARALALLKGAHALVVPGSDDPAYTASKIYPYLLAGRPLLAIFHERSSVVDLIARVGGGICVPFRTGEAPGDLGARIASAWLEGSAHDVPVPLDEAAFEPYTDRAAAEAMTECFTRWVA